MVSPFQGNFWGRVTQGAAVLCPGLSYPGLSGLNPGVSIPYPPSRRLGKVQHPSVRLGIDPSVKADRRVRAPINPVAKVGKSERRTYRPLTGRAGRPMQPCVNASAEIMDLFAPGFYEKIAG